MWIEFGGMLLIVTRFGMVCGMQDDEMKEVLHCPFHPHVASDLHVWQFTCLQSDICMHLYIYIYKFAAVLKIVF